MVRSFRTPDITIRVPFGTTEPERIALLQAAGIPLDAGGELAGGFLYERRPGRFGDGSIFRWLDASGDAAGPVAAASGHAPLQKIVERVSG
ncbi:MULTISPECIES: hypothetical protein [unclassified Variovorax]|jgi:hypothetical protein|uniref:hypothetical protein n=1 Tax=unclassified Variovorax TaxID=663243 RepID=UPI000C62B373|nr:MULTISPECIES: hypothetical protein [unclassified Variovorax]MBS79736.1 hypothetical protein [Variovorax sp.]MCT8177130.1 hypothetical protein [Variovorax sp. CY25R-8]